MRHRRIVLSLLLAAISMGEARAQELDLERRVAAHRAVERVLWEHRIWPEANTEPKPSLEAVLPDRDLRDRVDDVLRKSAALADLWKRPVGAAELQAELERMRRSSRDPKLLDAMLDAVDRDPLLAAEVIARPALVDRLIRSWYAGESFDAWWSAERTRHAPEVPSLDTAALSAPPSLSLPTCANDTWTPMSAGAPAGRWMHSAVWTGAEMIVWGGLDSGTPFGDGARYTPATDTWSPMSNAFAPAGRRSHAAVWTGSRMIVWGGHDGTQVVRTGGRYNPATDTWTPTSLTGAPSPRIPKAYVWMGSRLVVVGGDLVLPGTGGQYDPLTDTWTPTTTTGAPGESGTSRVAVWTGAWMVIYPGKRYDPVNDVWASITNVGAPLGNDAHTAVWTGTRMIVWGGYAGGTPLNSGARYDPTADAWTPMSTVGAPAPRAFHSAVWLGGRMVVWGGTDNSGTLTSPFETGGRYDPATDTWSPTTVAGAPFRRERHTAVATATEMIVWGGFGGPAPGAVTDTGGRYNPVTDSWVPTSGPAPDARFRHSVAWTGTEAVFWGGMAASVRLQSGARYVPATDSWSSTAVSGPTPTARADATAVWTGSAVVIWGGDDGGFAGTGARYDPASNSWSTMASLNSPAGRTDHTAVWTGSRMIVWGGRDGGGDLASGASYDPASNTWSAVSSAAAPAARSLHTAVWTGSTMIVWGGQGGGTELGDGGRYDPVADGWTPVSTSASPVPRKEHAAVWTGTRMLVWGGALGSAELQTGSAYDPAIDAWDAFAVAGAPPPRRRPRAVWTGSEMIVWGGTASGAQVQTGGRYLAAQNTWQATSTSSAPSAREQHQALWVGDQMIVWGGAQNGSAQSDGGRYCACLAWYPDQDGDGYGDTVAGETTCNGIPGTQGWVARSGDCNDGNPAIHPGVGDGCNGVDDDCDFQTDEDFLPQPSVCGQGVCRSFGTRECVNGQIVNDCVAGTPNSPTDTACNDLDDDCDGGVDEDFVPYPDHWVPIANAPSARTNYTAVSSGSEILVFGGDNGSGTVQTGGIAWSTTANTWRTLPAGPAKRWHHTAVWADTQMIVWGGDDNTATIYNTGSRYNPAADTWAATTTTGAPTARGGHVAVWTGSRMVIWGGRDVSTFMNTGSRYDPVANSWSATTTTGAPAGRWQATAVWTGTEMIVWGGVAAAGTGLNTGGRYNPSANTWTTMTTTGAPSGRYGHVAVWTGTEMIVWGGTSDGTSYLTGGARYNPTSNTWTPMASVNQPSRRAWASATWNGNELFVWGGTYRTNEEPDTVLADGARYSPGSDTWTTINPLSAPAARARTMAVLQGGEMWVWGGDPNGGAKLDGARYVPVTPCGTGYCQRTGTMVCSAGSASFQCTPGQPQPEVCDGFDDNCNGVPDDGIPVPGAAPMVVGSKLPGDVLQLSWIATPNTTSYDVVRGRTSALRGSGGNFTLSTDTCIVNNGASTQVQDPIGTPLAEATFYLVRPVNACSGNGTFDETSPTQQGARDAEIAASGGACP